MPATIHRDFAHCGDPVRRHDFILLFDVTLGNPNGDPDADNQPRQLDTNHGFVTDVCIKRKVRNYVALTQPQEKGATNRIYVQDKGTFLNDLHKEAHQAITSPVAPAQAATPTLAQRNDARAWMCANFYDVRMFGAVMSTKVNAGQVRGPVQMTFARSLDPILPVDVAISRVALTDEKEQKASEKTAAPSPEPSDDADPDAPQEERFGRTGTFGRKSIVPYGLYVGYGFVSAPFAEQTGISRADLELFWTALRDGWDLDHSASRGLMSCRGLYVFSHQNRLGNAPAQQLFDLLNKPSVGSPRSFEDYRSGLTLDTDNVPPGIDLTVLC